MNQRLRQINQPYISGGLAALALGTTLSAVGYSFIDRRTAHKEFTEAIRLAKGPDEAWTLDEKITFAQELGIYIPIHPSETTTLRFNFEGERIPFEGPPFTLSVKDYQSLTAFTVAIPRSSVEEYLARHSPSYRN